MDVMLIFDVVIAIFGVYMIGAALKMKKTGKISITSILLSSHSSRLIRHIFLHYLSSTYKIQYIH